MELLRLQRNNVERPKLVFPVDRNELVLTGLDCGDMSIAENQSVMVRPILKRVVASGNGYFAKSSIDGFHSLTMTRNTGQRPKLQK